MRASGRRDVEESTVVTGHVPASRDEAAAAVVAALAEACPAAEVRLIGSLAEPAAADGFSDIDLCWTIPPGQAPGELQSLRSTLEGVAEVESLRVDPEERPDECLVFVRFERWPLWWRVDLEIHSAGLGTTDVSGADPWSPAESACMRVVVTLKAVARGRSEAAEDLMARALRRVDATDVSGGWQLRLTSLLDHIETSSPPTADLVARTRRLVSDVLGG